MITHRTFLLTPLYGELWIRIRRIQQKMKEQINKIEHLNSNFRPVNSEIGTLCTVSYRKWR